MQLPLLGDSRDRLCKDHKQVVDRQVGRVVDLHEADRGPVE